MDLLTTLTPLVADLSFADVIALAALVGAGAVGGIFFAFSTFIMPALARLPHAEGIAAMQSINITVVRPSVFIVLLGTGVLSLIGFAFGSAWMSGAGAIYLGAVILVTGTRNVPLNEALAPLDPSSPEAQELWPRYLREWTRWNTVRTLAALAASLLFALAALEGGA